MMGQKFLKEKNDAAEFDRHVFGLIYYFLLLLVVPHVPCLAYHFLCLFFSHHCDCLSCHDYCHLCI